ncbi:MAG: zf-HC2 domain-containing protein [Polyangiales bacterium]
MKERNVGGLRCSEVLAVLSEYVDGELTDSVVGKVESHLLGCPDCERFGQNFGAMVVSLRKESEQSPEAELDVMARLLAQLRKAKAEA